MPRSSPGERIRPAVQHASRTWRVCRRIRFRHPAAPGGEIGASATLRSPCCGGRPWTKTA
jgi:hypothetical protein